MEEYSIYVNYSILDESLDLCTLSADLLLSDDILHVYLLVKVLF